MSITTSTLSKQILSEASSLIKSTESIVVLSGAGLSKASGIPTYRDADGLWQNPENLKYSHIETYRKDPLAFTQFWKRRLAEMTYVEPNAAHFSLRQLQKIKPQTVLVTQNVDGLLQQAGCTDVIELHGSLHRSRCEQCGFQAERVLERCLLCGSPMRLDVVLFGEMLNELNLEKAQRAAANAALMIVVGTTAEVYPAASLLFSASESGAKLIVIDTIDSPVDYIGDLVLKGKAEEVLPLLMRQISVYK